MDQIVVLTHQFSGSSYGLINGGKGGMIYTYLGALAGFTFVILSMAEMASMYVQLHFLPAEIRPPANTNPVP